MLVCVSLCQSVFVRDISLSDLSEVYAFVSVREMNVSVRGMCLCQSGVFLSLAVCVSRGYFCLWQSVSVGGIFVLAVCVSRGYFCLGSLCQSGVFLSWQSVSVGAIRLCPSEVCVYVSRGSFFFLL